MLDLINIKQKSQDIRNKRIQIAAFLKEASRNIKSNTIEMISASDLKLMFELYDKIFFQSWFKNSFQGKLKFSLSRRMTRSAGLTLCPKNIDSIKPEELSIEIRIGVDFFFHYGTVKGTNAVCGINTSSSLEAMQLVFEHELCHVIEFVLFKRSNCSGNRFKAIANNIFGQTESYHRLPTHKQIARQKMGINIGDTVSFTFEGKRLTGILYNINKRATVIVNDKGGHLTDRAGNRYSKYYVPLSLLE